MSADEIVGGIDDGAAAGWDVGDIGMSLLATLATSANDTDFRMLLELDLRDLRIDELLGPDGEAADTDCCSRVAARAAGDEVGASTVILAVTGACDDER